MFFLTLLGNYKKEIIAILIFMFFAFGLNIYRIQGDGELYFSVLEKVLHIPDPEGPVHLQKQPFFNSGCAFFNMPFYLTAYVIEKAIAHKPNFNGITLRSASINIASNFYMILTILLSFRILKLLNLRHRLVPIVSVLFSTSAFAVSTVTPSYSHAVDMFLTTIFLYMALRYSEKDSGKLFWLGALYPIITIVRFFNFVLIIPLITNFILKKEYNKIKKILLGALLTVWIFPIIFFFYNRARILPEASLVMLGGLPLFPKYSLKLLVHPIHGLFVWSPVTIFSALGLIKMADEKKKANGYLFLSTWILFVLVYGFFYDWHAGWSFSTRYLVNLFALYVVGLAYFLEQYGKVALLLTALATFYSVFLFFNWYICVFHGQWGTPIDMVRAWLTGESYYFSGKKVNVSIFLHRIFNLFRYKHILGFFR